MNISKISEILNKRNLLIVLILILIPTLIGFFYNSLIPNSLSFIYKPTKIESINDSSLFSSNQGSNPIKKDINLINPVKDSTIKPEEINRTKSKNLDSLKLIENTETKKIKEEENSLGIKTVNFSQMKKIINSSEFIIIDARQAEQYQKGHIPGAINIFALDEPDYKVPKILDLPQNKKIIVYCDGGNCDLSLELSKELKKVFGFKQVFLYEAGWEEWSKLYKNKI